VAVAMTATVGGCDQQPLLLGIGSLNSTLLGRTTTDSAQRVLWGILSFAFGVSNLNSTLPERTTTHTVQVRRRVRREVT